MDLEGELTFSVRSHFHGTFPPHVVAVSRLIAIGIPRLREGVGLADVDRDGGGGDDKGEEEQFHLSL